MRYLLLPVLMLVVGSTTAFADAIDGDWCSPKQQHVSIDGPVIVTPGGQRTTGNYGRHTFDYIIPDGEAGAGDAISMTQHSEQRITVRRKPAGSEEFSDPVPWRRCNLTS